MHNTIETQAETPKRFQCRHIFTDGHRCGSPCLRGEDLCYYHHTTRKPASHPHTRRSHRSTFEIPLPEDRSAIQHSIGQVLQRIAANDIDPRRASLLLYGLQIASLNLPKPAAHRNAKPEAVEIVEEIIAHPELGTLAPLAEVSSPEEPRSSVAKLIEKLIRADEAARQPQETNILPTLNAEAASSHSTRRRATQHKISSKKTPGAPSFAPFANRGPRQLRWWGGKGGMYISSNRHVPPSNSTNPQTHSQKPSSSGRTETINRRIHHPLLSFLNRWPP